VGRKVNNQSIAKTVGKGKKSLDVYAHVTCIRCKQRGNNGIYAFIIFHGKLLDERTVVKEGHRTSIIRAVCCSKISIPALLLVGKCIHFYKRNKKSFEQNEKDDSILASSARRKKMPSCYLQQSHKFLGKRKRWSSQGKERERERERRKIEQASDNGSRE